MERRGVSAHFRPACDVLVALRREMMYTVVEFTAPFGAKERSFYADDSWNYYSGGSDRTVRAGRCLDLQTGRLER